MDVNIIRLPLKGHLLLLTLVLLLFPSFVFSQQDSIVKSPQEIQLAKEKKAEKKYLQFQDYFFKAIQEKAGEDYAKAITFLEECKQIYPNDVGMNFEFAKNYLLLKDYENAIFFNEKILLIQPKNHFVLEHLKKTYRLQNDYENAIATQYRIIAIKPSKKQELMMLYISNRQRSKAKQVFLELESNNQIIDNENYYRRVLFRTKKTKPKAVRKVVKTNSLVDNNSIARLRKQFLKEKQYSILKQLLIAVDKEKKFTTLEEDSKIGLELFPAQAFVYFMQGKAQNQLKKYQDAIEILEVGLDFILDDIFLELQFYKELKTANIAIGNPKRATQYATKIIALQKKK